MRRFVRPFRRLHWQLTLTYLLITLVAVVTLEAANIAADIASTKAVTESSPEMLLGDMQWLAPQLAPYLDTATPNYKALGVRVSSLVEALSGARAEVKAAIAKDAVSAPSAPLTLIKSQGSHVSVAITDAKQHLIVAASSDAAGGVAIMQGAAVDGATQDAVSTALTGRLKGKDPHFLGTLGDRRTVAAVPLLGSDGHQVGMLVSAAVLESRLQSQTDVIFSTIQAQNLLPSAVYFMLMASLIGTFSGLLASRSIRRRLRGIAAAAGLWSHGELQTEIPDARDDELGQLALNLNRMAAQLGHLMTAREALAVVEERHRLARDLHDSVKQQFFVVTMLIGTARIQASGAPEAEHTLAEAERLAAAAQQELTSLIRALRPLVLTNKGLGAALHDLLDDWTQRSGIAATARIASELPLDPNAEQELFRVAQEALTNVVRHSGASSVEVDAQTDGETVLLRMTDDGHGFDPMAQAGGRHGLGLTGMRERVEVLGGSLLIFSTATGTRIEVRVPASRAVTPAGNALPAAQG